MVNMVDFDSAWSRLAIYLSLGLGIVVYWAFLLWIDPLAKYPGPLLAKISNLWMFYHTWSSDLPDRLLELHQQYGSIVRVGPNSLDFDGSEAIQKIYKVGRVMPKASFYQGFTTFQANLFGTQDEELHSLRRRQMAHSFSAKSLKDMEYIFDGHIAVLCRRLDGFANSGEAFDLKEAIACFAYDMIGELAFSTQFESQKATSQDRLPPIADHVLLACLIGIMSGFLPYSKTIVTWLPIPWLRHLINSRTKLRNQTLDCVNAAMATEEGNTNLLTHLIQAKDPDTGADLTKADICSEAFGFLIAGGHTTSSTLTLLFFHLLHNPQSLEKLLDELDRELPLLSETEIPYTMSQLEKNLVYEMACVRENFRLAPVFTMALPRVVTPLEGIDIDGFHVPFKTNVGITNYCLHHNSKIWGDNHGVFDPERWMDKDSADYVGLLMSFGMGHRSCIGRNIAMMNILKVTATLLRNYKLEAVNLYEKLEILHRGVAEKKGPLMCKVEKRN